MIIKPIEILKTFYPRETDAFKILRIHSELVAKKSVQLAMRQNKKTLDVRFIWEAAMLHDIGIFLTDAPQIGCFGKHPYICHGYLGKKLLQKKGMNKHAKVCERHVGVGLTSEDIQKQNIPLPERDMIPETLEEKIICYADKFYSKSGNIHKEKSIDTIERELCSHNDRSVDIFRKWHEMFA